jgi:hypothetical protein
MSNWFIAAQILGVITICFEFASYQIKDKTKYFLVTGIGSLFWGLMFASMGMATGMSTQFSLIILAIFSTARNLIFYATFAINSPRSREFGLICLIFMLVAGVVSGIITVMNVPEQVRWLHALGLLAALGFVLGQYLPGVHAVRIAVVIYAVLVILTQTPINILYGDFRWNVMGIAIELAKIASVAVFYLRYSKQETRPRLELSKI